MFDGVTMSGQERRQSPDVGSAAGASIGAAEFERLRRLFHEASGIRLSDNKKVLVCGRLSRRLRHLGLPNYRAYLDLIERPDQRAERQLAIDLLTTNETHFFREPKHFERLHEELRQCGGGVRQPYRVWSAACSTGEEPYSLAMTLAETLGARPWSVLATDLSHQVLQHAREAIYGQQRAREVPEPLFSRYLLEGVDEFAGRYRVDDRLRERVQFEPLNLTHPLPALEPFDAIFLRNVLIYFDVPAKQRIVGAIVDKLKPGGLLFIGHSESLNGICDRVDVVVPTVFRRPP